MKKILVACGLAIVTSTIVSKKIEAILEEKNVTCEIVQGKVSEVVALNHELKPDLIICTCQLEESFGVPVMDGRSFLTGINLGDTTKKLLELLEK